MDQHKNEPTITYEYTPYSTQEVDSPAHTITYANMPYSTHEFHSRKPVHKRKTPMKFIWIPIIIILLVSVLITYFYYQKLTPLLPYCLGYTLSSILAMMYFGVFYAMK